jgi:hypothetical protein
MSSGGPLEDTGWSCGILGLIKILLEKKTKKEMTDQNKRRQMSGQTCKAGTEKDKKWKICEWQICFLRNQKIDR